MDGRNCRSEAHGTRRLRHKDPMRAIRAKVAKQRLLFAFGTCKCDIGDAGAEREPKTGENGCERARADCLQRRQVGLAEITDHRCHAPAIPVAVLASPPGMRYAEFANRGYHP